LVNAISSSAKTKIENAGGKVEIVSKIKINADPKPTKKA
jgi:hypothetical protein